MPIFATGTRRLSTVRISRKRPNASSLPNVRNKYEFGTIRKTRQLGDRLGLRVTDRAQQAAIVRGQHTNEGLGQVHARQSGIAGRCDFSARLSAFHSRVHPCVEFSWLVLPLLSLFFVLSLTTASLKSALVENTPHLGKKIRKQLVGGCKCVGPPLIVLRAVPMIVLVPGTTRRTANRAARRHAHCRIRQPLAQRIMQGKGVAQTVRTFRRRLYARDLRFQPVAFFEMVHTSIEC